MRGCGRGRGRDVETDFFHLLKPPLGSRDILRLVSPEPDQSSQSSLNNSYLFALMAG